MNLIIEGVLFGLTLSVLIGPIFVVLTQTTITKGFKAGLLAASGVWTSDIIFILVYYAFIQSFAIYIEDAQFQFWSSLIGGIIILGFGVVILIKKQKIEEEIEELNVKRVLNYWSRGFLVNSVNPFTFIFWLGTISANVIGRSLTHFQSAQFLGSILLTIVVTDLAKVILAKKLTGNFRERFIILFSKLAGIGLILFGIFLISQI